MRISDWSSDVCSSDLQASAPAVAAYKHKPPLRSTISMKLSHRWPGGQTNAPTFRSTSKCFQHCAISLLFRHTFAHTANRIDGVVLLHIVLHRCRYPQ